MTHEIQNNRHYSEQPGHFARGQAARTREAVEKQFPHVPFMPPHDVTQGQVARRQMRRVTRDGRQ